MQNNFMSNLACAILAVVATTLSLAEVTSVQSMDFTYDQPTAITYEA